jgi:hypothetical protein
MEENLSYVEKEAYELIKTRGEIMAKQLPVNLSGAVPQLVRKNLVEVIKKEVSPFSSKKLKYIRLKE